MRLKEGFPGWNANEKGTQKFKAFEGGKGGAPFLENGIVDASAKIKAKIGEIGVEESKSGECRRRQVLN